GAQSRAEGRGGASGLRAGRGKARPRLRWRRRTGTLPASPALRRCRDGGGDRWAQPAVRAARAGGANRARDWPWACRPPAAAQAVPDRRGGRDAGGPAALSSRRIIFLLPLRNKLPAKQTDGRSTHSSTRPSSPLIRPHPELVEGCSSLALDWNIL